MTHHKVGVADVGQKLMSDAKGGRSFKVYQKEFRMRLKVLKES